MMDVSAHTHRYLSAQLAGDRAAGLEVIEDLLATGAPAHSVLLDVVQAAQYEIGRLWEENRISIAQEHVATAISQVAVAHVYQRLPRRPATGKRVMIACVEGEQHELGARLVADFLESGGVRVLYLGANVPTDSLVALARVERPDLLALSVALDFNVPALRRAVTELRAATPATPIVAGGYALARRPALATELGVISVGEHAARAVDVIRGVIGV